MSDKNKNIKTQLDDLFRYRRNELSESERNAFERELQKDPFLAEASEGFESISPGEATKDIADLQRLLETGKVKKQRFVFYRIAASIAVLMILSAIYVFVSKNKPEKQLSQNSAKPETFEVTKNQPVVAPADSEVSDTQKMLAYEKKADQPSSKGRVEETVSNVSKDEKTKTAAAMIYDTLPVLNVEPAKAYVAEKRSAAPVAAMAKQRAVGSHVINGRVFSAEDNMPIPGANVLIKGTKQGVVTDIAGNFRIAIPDSADRTLIANFIGMEPKEVDAKSDTQVQIKLDPSLTSLSEVVVVGYGASKKEAEEQDVLTDYAPPQPVTGKADFDRYILNNLHRPDSATKGQRVVVVVSFLVRTDGTIDSIKIIRSPGKSFSDEAIRVIKEGPAWKPAYDNGKSIEDEVRVRIVFR
jgi:TonB family protein